MFNDSIQLRVRLALLLLAVLPIVSIGLILTTQTAAVQREQVIQLQAEITERVSQSVSNFALRHTRELQLATQVANLRSLTQREQSSLLLELQTSDPVYDSVSILDSAGQELARVSRTGIITQADLRNLAEDVAFITASAGRNYFGGVRVDRATSQLVATLSYPIIDPRSGMVANVVIADVRLGFIAPLLADINDANTTTYILNEAGRVVAHANSSVVLRETIYRLPALAGVLNGLSGEESVVAFTQIPNLDDNLYAVTEQKTSTAFALVDRTLLTLGVAVVVNLALAGLLAILATRLVVRPLEELAQVAQKIEAGDLSQRVVVTRRDEIGLLGRTFNSMTQQLSNLIENLELRVNQRTRDLTVAAEVSRQVTRLTDLRELLPTLTELTRESFELYYVAVFIYEELPELLRLSAGTGEAGRQMLLENKQFALADTGLVPLAARSVKPQVINNVKESPDHFENPLLKETRAEMTLPMRVGSQLVGVLDLQSIQVDRFGEDDVRVFTSLAEQIAVAIRNAQLFEDVQKAQQEAEKANVVKSMFLASMSHELRTPLNSIINFTKFVIRGIMGPVNERQVETLNNVAVSGEHLLALINDVLDISKIESGSLNLFKEANIDLSELVTRAETTAQSLIGEKPITIEVTIAPDLPKVTCDKQRIMQVLLNVVSNACKFTDEGFIRIAVTHNAQEVLLSVADSGSGIAPEDYQKVFTTFMQTQSGLRQGSGTGLGMPISKNLVEAHGGRMWIESELGAGATFYFTLPLLPEKTTA